MKISRAVKKFSIQAADFDRSVCMAAICYNGPISAVLTNEQLLGEKMACVKFHINILKTEGLVGISNSKDGQTKSTQLVTLIFILYIHTYIFIRPPRIMKSGFVYLFN